MAQFPLKGFPVSNLLLITDVARLRKIFSRLTEDKNIRLRVVNNLEKGGEEIAIEKPDVVFVQTHLSGLSADILLMHLKKQLGRKRSRFVLLAASGEMNDAISKSYQGWLDTSTDDSRLLSDLQQLLLTLLNKPKKGEEPVLQKPASSTEYNPQPENFTDSPAPSDLSPVSAPLAGSDMQLQATGPVVSELSLEEQGLTYAPRQRLRVYSEFNSSFDSAVSTTPEPESLEQATPASSYDWRDDRIDTVEAKPLRSKRNTFLLWLAPVVIIVIVITYLQQQKPTAKQEPATVQTAPAAVVKPVALPSAASAPPTDSPKAPVAPTAAPAAAPHDQDRMSDKAVLSAIAENRGSKKAAPAPTPGARPVNLPDFIPRAGYDKQFSAANPGWERYKGSVTEFKVLREAQAIKAIQIIDRGGQGVPESFMKGVLRQVTKTPNFKTETAEKKEGYEIQRGSVADNIKVVFYRDENGGRLRAFVLTWQ
jgi:CheY-like chemotaxis protein